MLSYVTYKQPCPDWLHTDMTNSYAPSLRGLCECSNAPGRMQCECMERGVTGRVTGGGRREGWWQGQTGHTQCVTLAGIWREINICDQVTILHSVVQNGWVRFYFISDKMGAKDLAQYLEENDKLGQIELYRSGVNKKQKHNQYFTSKS